MSEDYGTGVTRTLSALHRQYDNLVNQYRKPPLHSEDNLRGQMSAERMRLALKAMMPSGFFLDPTRALHDFQFDPLWSNHFVFGRQRTAGSAGTVLDGDELDPSVWAHVNGWILPVAGSSIELEGDVRNLIRMYPPPESSGRVDLVFLEVWATLVDPNPSTAHKPSASTVWKWGNVLYGGTNIVDDLEDPNIGIETSRRVQVQYRLRVFGQGSGLGSGVALDVYPDGLGDPNVYGQGAGDDPVVSAAYRFQNMREELGDPSLWRGGDGDPNNELETVDGYTYAIPVCAVFRRNSDVFVAATSAGNPNQNGAFNRNPSAINLSDPLDGAKVLLTASLEEFLEHDTTGVISITNLNGSGLEDPDLVLTSTFLVIDDEIISITAVDPVGETVTLGQRGRYGTDGVGHTAETVVQFFNSRPDGVFSDQVVESDVLDLRRGINPGDWDFRRILLHNVGALAKGDLRTAWKQSGAGDTEGPVVVEVGYLLADGGTSVPNNTEPLDGPDGVRMVWSDGATPQFDITELLDNAATLDGDHITAAQFNTGVEWDVDPGFYPSGFMNLGASLTEAWTNGSSIFLHIGGNDGDEGARGTFRDGGTRAVRFVTPKEYWRSGFPTVDPLQGNQYPVSLRFTQERAHQPVEYIETPGTLTTELPKHPGPMYPWRDLNFERPFIVLGGVLRPNLRLIGISTDAATFRTTTEQLTGTVEILLGSLDTVTGTGTLFESELAVRDRIVVDGTPYRVTEVVSDTEATITPTATGAVAPGTLIYKVTKLEIDVGVDFDLAGDYFQKDTEGNFLNDPSQIANPLLYDRRTLFGMLTDNGRDITGASSEVYIVVYGDPAAMDNNGCFKVLGAGAAPGSPTFGAGYTTHYGQTATTVVVDPLSADFTGFVDTSNTVTVEFRSQETNVEDGSGFVSGDSALAIVMTDIGGLLDHPWNATTLDNLALPIDPTVERVAVESKAVLGSGLMYNPGRGGTARVPDDIMRVSRRAGSSATYLRQAPGALDPTFPGVSGMPEDEAFYDPMHVQTWNRLSSRGWHAPLAPSYGGQVIGFTEQDRDGELFVDKGSKTVIFRPFRSRSMTLQGQTTIADPSLIGDLSYPDATPKDGYNIFTSSKTMGYPVPREFMPRFGRQDIPFYQSEDASGSFFGGINHLFTDSTGITGATFDVIGGEDNNGNPVASTLLFATGTGPGYGGTFTVMGRNAYNIRKSTDIDGPFTEAAERLTNELIAVVSSDLGAGLKGLQLPPYIGPARVLGVYDRRDFDAKGGLTFKSNRYEPEPDGATNLLRTDVDRQTLFILQDGAEDVTGEPGDHTYIIPSDAIDITKSPDWVGGATPEVFENLDYVVECTVFGFAKNWINENNFVLARRHNGAGILRTDGDDPELLGAVMCLPSPAAINENLYVAADRTVYQGDVFMTRDGETRTVSDYENRYGQVPVASAHWLGTPIQQYEIVITTDGDCNTIITIGGIAIETPNPRAFEVLAAIDFYTTLGTGNVGGTLYPGTPLDVGHVQNTPEAATRIPATPDSTQWRTDTRAFTEGQKTNTSRASAHIEVLDNDLLCPTPAVAPYRQAVIQLDLLDGTSERFYAAAGLTHESFLVGTGISIDNIFRVDEDSTTRTISGFASLSFPQGFNAKPSLGQQTQTVTLLTGIAEQARTADRVLVTRTSGGDLHNDYGAIVYDAYIPADGQIRVRGTYTLSALAFEQLPQGNTQQYSVGFAANIPAHSSDTVGGLTFQDVTGGNLVMAGPTGISGLPDGIILTAHVDGLDTVAVTAHNTTDGAVAMGTKGVKVAFLEDADSIPLPSITVSGVGFTFALFKEAGTIEGTIVNLVDKVNAHPKTPGSLHANLSLTNTVGFTAVPTGEEGNALRVSVSHVSRSNIPPYPEIPSSTPVQDVLRVLTPSGNDRAVGAQVTSTLFAGGQDLPVNAGNGTTQLRLTGMTERFPMGILLQDADFLGENPLGDDASAFKTSPSAIQAIQTLLPLTTGGEEFSRFLGEPGTLVAMADGKILGYVPWGNATPTGTKRFRLYRGGGSSYLADGEHPGGPIDWASESFPKTLQPVLKGGVLVCKALLVRNYYEEAFAATTKTSDGDEIQMLLITTGVLGDGQTQIEGVSLAGLISPTGYGEGYSAADRYRCAGRPMFRGFTRDIPNLEDIRLAVYTGPEEE
jgi:hypothetical protein